MTDLQYRIAIQKVSSICYPKWHYEFGKCYYGIVTDFGVVGSTTKRKNQWKNAYNQLVQLKIIKTTTGM
jgi:hypothetical protein